MEMKKATMQSGLIMHRDISLEVSFAKKKTSIATLSTCNPNILALPKAAFEKSRPFPKPSGPPPNKE